MRIIKAVNPNKNNHITKSQSVVWENFVISFFFLLRAIIKSNVKTKTKPPTIYPNHIRGNKRNNHKNTKAKHDSE